MTSTSPAARGGRVHFAIALAALGVIAAGIYLFKAPISQPVPWPENVTVTDTYEMISLPEKLGPYHLTDKGRVSLKEDVLKALGLSTSYDRMRRPERRSSWYAGRIYEDTRREPDSPYRFWRLDVYYYTGLRDNVPHVPERCLEAAGVRVVSQENVSFEVLTAPSGWDEGVKFQRVHFRRTGEGDRASEGAEYYTFSLNGKPETAWEKVRLTLNLPWGPTHTFFAKIQFTPFGQGGIESTDQADAAAEEFVNYFLPAVLSTIPTAHDVDVLEKTHNQTS